MVRILQEGQHLGVDRPKSQDMFCYSGCSSSCREEERGLVDIVCVGEGGSVVKETNTTCTVVRGLKQVES